ncbi:MAG TPA: hypothetical protein VM934_12765 [Pyrinomonadaceae bacterium]|jgi:hypothetical protein|nr:hypothetical protein [Pyrinomonadaceae bacterium]
MKSLKGNVRRHAAALCAAVVLVGTLLPAVSGGVHGAGNGKRPKVVDSILGIRLGSSLEDAHKRLKSLGTVGGRETREGGRKEAWTLKKTEFASIAYKTNDEGHIVWMTGFVRPGKEIPFSKLGDLTQAARQNRSEVVWNVVTPEGGYRLVAKGPEGRARVVYLLSLTEGED